MIAYRNRIKMQCPHCRLSLRLKSAIDDFGELVQSFECVHCPFGCEISVDQWTEQGRMPDNVGIRH